MDLELTTENSEKLKFEKRIGFIFALLVIAFGALINLVYIISNHEKSLLLLLLIDIGIVGLSYLICFLINRKINKDLRLGIKTVRIEKIEEKRDKTDCEVGSGVLYIPILGNLFPKLWGQKMKGNTKYILMVKEVGYTVEKKLFDSVIEGGFVEIHDSTYSNIFLELKKSIN